MDYEKKYKEAVNKIRDLLDDGEKNGFTIVTYKTDLESIFPELKESEDERIRKVLIELSKEVAQEQFFINRGTNLQNVIAWLEKQESVNEIVSRCRTSWYNEGKIAGMAEGLTDDEKYQQGWHDALEKQDECHISHDDEIMIKQLTEYFTTGHGLQNTNETVVEWLNDVKEKLEKQGEQKKSYDTCDSSMMDNKKSPYGEKRDFGYFEEKPADKVEPKFKVGDVVKNKKSKGTVKIVQILHDSYCYSGWDGAATVHSDFSISEQDDWELVEQKSTWSEEDIELIDNTIKFIEDRVAATSPSLRTYSPTLTGKEIPFLKALKDRVHPKQEWSEEDKKMLEKCIDAASGYYSPEDKQSMKDWLYSLKDRYTWRPSKREKEALLWCVVHLGGADKQTLGELLEALNKL